MNDLDKILVKMLDEARPIDAKPFYYGDYKKAIIALLTQAKAEARIDEVNILKKALSPHKGVLAILNNELIQLKSKGEVS